MSCNKVCTKCSVVICGKKFSRNFLLIDNYDFDIILEMDWLSWVHAFIDCEKKSLVFQIPNQSEFEFPEKAEITNQMMHLDKCLMGP